MLCCSETNIKDIGALIKTNLGEFEYGLGRRNWLLMVAVKVKSEVAGRERQMVDLVVSWDDGL